ncbi:MAG: precorrin-4 C(11)-methyltransferase [Desulfovibrionaceae bacterium]|nr:precorrin-4 C(11)-methyltransferase [Desulfovibrionaceae bacterium]
MSEQKNIQGQVIFIGAGPGDPELLTIKAHKFIQKADLIIYAGSLVPKAIFADHKPSATLIDSAALNLTEIISKIKEFVSRSALVCRIHAGDPGLFGTIREETTALTIAGIKFSIVPGITAASAAAAKAGISFTVPTVCQSLILTRLAGRTQMPALEKLADLARHKTSLAIYLSAGKELELEQELLKAGLPKTTPILCAYRLGFEDECLIWTTIQNLRYDLAQHNFKRQTLFLVLPGEEKAGQPSKLYADNFSHSFRQN